MKIKTYQDPAVFLQRAQEWLEEEEAVNSLMLGRFASARTYLNRLMRQQLPPEGDAAGLVEEIDQAEQAARRPTSLDTRHGTTLPAVIWR